MNDHTPTTPSASETAGERTELLSEALQTLCRAFDRIHTLPRSSDSDLAKAMGLTIAKLQKAKAAALAPKPDAVAKQMFPIMGGPNILPWSLIEPFEQQAQRNHGQPLKRLAERGGLDMGEAMAVMTCKPWHEISTPTLDQFQAFVRQREVEAAEHVAALSRPAKMAERVDMESVMGLWQQHGGGQHGPHVETVTMPLSRFCGFVDALRKLFAAP